MTRGAFENAVAAVRGTPLLVEEELCINLRGRGMLCRRCEKACPATALTLTKDDIELDAAVCTGCGACVPVCPAGTLRLPVFDPERFIELTKGLEEIHLHCSESKDSNGGIVIPCFLLFDKSLAAAAMAEGVRRFHLHGIEGCETCTVGDARRRVDSIRRALAKWFGNSCPEISASEQQAKANCGPQFRPNEAVTDRRGFLRMAGVRAAAGVAWLVPVEDNVEDHEIADHPFWTVDLLPRKPVGWRMVLSDRAGSLPWPANTALPWYARSLGESCNACMACAERCPTGALVGETVDFTRSISFDTALCTNCTLCQRICPMDAVRARPVRSSAEAQASRSIVMHMTMSPCEQCGALQPRSLGGATLCAVCANEQEMDEEWLEMLEG